MEAAAEPLRRSTFQVQPCADIVGLTDPGYELRVKCFVYGEAHRILLSFTILRRSRKPFNDLVVGRAPAKMRLVPLNVMAVFATEYVTGPQSSTRVANRW